MSKISDETPTKGLKYRFIPAMARNGPRRVAHLLDHDHHHQLDVTIHILRQCAPNNNGSTRFSNSNLGSSFRLTTVRICLGLMLQNRLSVSTRKIKRCAGRSRSGCHQLRRKGGGCEDYTQRGKLSFTI